MIPFSKKEGLNMSEEKPQTDADNAKSEKKENKVRQFFITTLNGMAYGLFATLIIGTIIYTIGGFFPGGEEANAFCRFMNTVLTKGALCLEYLTGAGIGVGVAITMKKNPLQTIVLAGVGELAAYFSLSTRFVTDNVINNGQFQVGDPLTVYLVVIATALLMQLVLRKKTPVDILLVPLFGIAVGLTSALLIRFPAIYVTYAVQWLVNSGTNAVPFLMGIIVSVLMGMALTAPISSAAIGAMVFTLPAGVTISEALASSEYSGLVLASGAACVGCCCQMLGFAVMSRKDNPIGMVVSIGIGTSMLQFKNILKKPLIWLPTILASAILGPVSTCGLKLVCMGSSAGMGTSGLVGLIGLYSSMGNTWQTWLGMFGLCVALPIVIVWIIDILFRKLNWIKPGDLKI